MSGIFTNDEVRLPTVLYSPWVSLMPCFATKCNLRFRLQLKSLGWCVCEREYVPVCVCLCLCLCACVHVCGFVYERRRRMKALISMAKVEKAIILGSGSKRSFCAQCTLTRTLASNSQWIPLGCYRPQWP